MSKETKKEKEAREKLEASVNMDENSMTLSSMDRYIESQVEEEKKEMITRSVKDPIQLGSLLLAEIPSLIRCSDSLYAYNGKCYDILNHDRILIYLRSFLRKYGITQAWSKRNDIISSIVSDDKIPEVKKMNDYKSLMCLNNCILDIYTRQVISHSPQYYFDSFINVDFNGPESDCPNFMKYLEDTFSGDKVIIENVIRLGGYLLDTSCAADKMFMFDGPGGSGKSTLINAYSMFFDDKQITALSLEDLASKTFDKELLVNSRFNQCAETKKDYIRVEEIKKIVTGDNITVSRKFKLAITFRPKTKIVVACNGVPKYSDSSDAIFRRLLIIPFHNQYRSAVDLSSIVNYEKRGYKLIDHSLEDKIREEKNAILNLFLDGLVRLKSDHYQFQMSVELVEQISNLRKDSDSVREFLEDNYEICDTIDGKTEETSIKDILDSYRYWYRRNVQDTGPVKIRSNEIGKRIKDVFNVNASSRGKVFDPETSTYEFTSFYPIRRIPSSNAFYEETSNNANTITNNELDINSIDFNSGEQQIDASKMSDDELQKMLFH